LKDDGISGECGAEILGYSIRTVQRYQKNVGSKDGRKGATKKVHNKLSEEERQRLLQIACSPKYADLSANKIIPMLADQGIYLGSERSLSRLLKQEELNAYRRREKKPTYTKPMPLVANNPREVWSWDITYLPSRILGKHFYCYVFLDVFSRKIVGWEIEDRECGSLASKLLAKICEEESISIGKLVLHQDN
jgi:putative transposase